MAGGLNLSTAVEVFPCAECGETLNTSLASCPFCGTAVDHNAALISAAETSRISQACSDASYLKIMSWGLVASVPFMFVPFLGMAGLGGIWFFRVAIPLMVVRWWIKFGSIKTKDKDFSSAKSSAILVSVVAVVGLATFLR